ncbi:MAG: metallophosphoesterase, partial [Acidobacteria bacterium]|nr:metallophosphoesterase [Acidobacteriota bacterium]
MAKINLTRRQFLGGLAATGLVGLSAAAAYASLFEPYNYELTETDIFVRDLPESFEGFRIAHISDVHHSRLVPLEEVQRVVQIAREAKPDLVALTGDYTTSRRRYVEPCAEALGALEPPEGAWAVLGNHDHYTDAELTMRALARAKINVLDNANTLIRRGTDTLRLAGINDWSWNGADWTRALRGLEGTHPSVLLSHQPSVLDLPQTDGLSLI